jgi:hypothetical protein
VTTSVWQPSGQAPAHARTLTLRLTDIAALRVDLARARLAGPEAVHIEVVTDGRTRLVVAAPSGPVAVVLPHAGHWTVTLRHTSVLRMGGR